ncbi:hypothetical protein B0H14DRAFT_3458743 [Mycena olivaceomarginata]|nr:hypothetical protein B0H14DRAFT_3458743 [Mycena olivaceomarginata]
MPLQLPQENSSGGSRWQTISFTSDTTSRTNIANAQGEATSEQWSVICGWLLDRVAPQAHLLVTVDRGRWLRPQFFKESKVFYKVNKDISWVDDTDNKVHGLMPGFPVRFLIAKGIVIRISHGANASSETKTADAASSASYMIQRMDSDEAELMPAQLPANFFISDDDYNKAVNGTQPDHDIVTNPAGG